MARISRWKETAWSELEHRAPVHVLTSERRRALRPVKRAEECKNTTLGELRKNLRREMFALEERLEELLRRDDALSLKLRKFNLELDERLNRWDERRKDLEARLEEVREELQEAADSPERRQLQRVKGTIIGHLGLLRKREDEVPSKIQDFSNWIDVRFERLEHKIEDLSRRHRIVRRMLQGVDDYIREYGVEARIARLEVRDGQLLTSLHP